jgi:hypothetical protein
VNMEGRAEGARELILAVFRLGVADYLGHSYSHDGDAAVRSVGHRWASEAAIFLIGPWAACLGDLIGLDSRVIWREARLRGEPKSAELRNYRAA